ncbi:MAG: S8/S53 family peptidase [Candidatus Aminicenantes bacterium]|nr:S8/S53 family peptidase [Candidatus Aminicenantes bacterium]
MRLNESKKRSFLLLAICLTILGCLIYFKFIRPIRENNKNEYQTILNQENVLGIVKHPKPSGVFMGRLDQLPNYDPDSVDLWQVDLRGADLSSLNLNGKLDDLFHADFDDNTRWPADLPPGFSPENIMKLGKNPGLGIRRLHEQGITGKGVSLAIIDQPLLVDHIEYARNLKLYEQIHSVGDIAQMHGPAVASIAVGKNVGVAPEAELYYIAESHGNFTDKGFQWDFSYLAQSIERIREINRKLPKERKIRVISISVGWSPGQKGYKKMMAVVEKALAEGVFIVSSSIKNCYEGKFSFNGLGRYPDADPELLSSYSSGIFWSKKSAVFSDQRDRSNTLLVPMDSRCTASPSGENDYVFYREGGWSWSIPYIAGLYALACQVSPDMNPEIFWEAATTTADSLIIRKDGTAYSVGRIVNPLKMISRLKKL